MRSERRGLRRDCFVLRLHLLIELSDASAGHLDALVKLDQPLAESMKLKRELMEDVIEVYTDAADYGVAEVTTAATFQLGKVYEQFSEDLFPGQSVSNLFPVDHCEYPTGAVSSQNQGQFQPGGFQTRQIRRRANTY